MDFMRGGAILLVIFNHAIHNNQQRSALHAPELLLQLNDVLAPIRMPMMVFLSGLLVTGSLRKPTRDYLGGKLRNIAWPFFVWTAVGICWVAVVLYLRGDPQRDIGPLTIFVRPYNHLWFLEYIFLYYLVAWFTKWVNPLWFAGLATVASLMTDAKPQRFFFLLACFMIGVWFSKKPKRFETIVANRWAQTVSIAVVGTVASLHFAGFDVRSELRYSPLSLPVVAAALVIVGRVSMSVAEQRWAAPIREIGRLSLVYYVVHGYPVEMGAMAAVAVVGQGFTTILVAFLSGLGAAALAGWAYNRSRMARLFFEIPRRTRRETAGESSSPPARI